MSLASLREEIKNISSKKKDIRTFSWTVSIVFFLISLYFFFINEKDTSLYFFIPSILILAINFIAFALLRPIQKAWMTLALLLGYIMNRLILILLFYGIFTPIGLILRILKKDLLNIKMKRNQSSYWNQREKKKSTKENYERQF